MDIQAWDFFGLSSPIFSRRVGRVHVYIALWTLFMRDWGTGKFASGFGLLQIDTRHLFYVGRSIDIADEYGPGHDRWFLCVAFLWLIGRAP